MTAYSNTGEKKRLLFSSLTLEIQVLLWDTVQGCIIIFLLVNIVLSGISR